MADHDDEGDHGAAHDEGDDEADHGAAHDEGNHEADHDDAHGGADDRQAASGVRTTAPQSPYTGRDVGVGAVIALIGVLVTFGVPLLVL